MNDDTDKPLNTVGDDALEARITAWVLGEASSFEAGELEKLCAADPALSLFERRLRVLHGLVAEDFKAGPAAEWKLSAERRTKITDLLGVEPEVEQKIATRRKKSRGPSVRGLILALAACAVLGFISISLLGGVGESAKRQKSAVAVNFSAGGGGGGSEAPMAMAPAADAIDELEVLRSELGSLRLERESGVPVKKPDTSYAHLADNSAFTSKPPPAARPAELPGLRGKIMEQEEVVEDKRKLLAAVEGKQQSAYRNTDIAGIANETTVDAKAELDAASNSLALLKEKSAKSGAAGMPEQKWVTRSEVEGISGLAPATPVPAPAAKPAALAQNEVGDALGGKGEANGRGFLGGGMVGGDGAARGLSAESAPEIAARRNTDFISTVDGVAIPGLPGAPGTDVTDIVTAGNRSGDGAITRNNIDAILNNPARREKAEAKGDGIAAVTGVWADDGFAPLEKSVEEMQEGEKTRLSTGVASGPEVEYKTRNPKPGEPVNGAFGGGADSLADADGVQLEPPTQSRFSSSLRLGAERVVVQDEPTAFGNVEEMGRLSRDRQQVDLGNNLFYSAGTAGDATGPSFQLTDLAKKQNEAEPAAAVAGRWFGTATDESTKGLKDANVPGGADAPGDPFFETPLLPGQPVGGLKRDLNDEFAPTLGDAEGEVLAKRLAQVNRTRERVLPPIDGPVADPAAAAEPARSEPALGVDGGAAVDEVRRKLYLAEGASNLGKYEESQKAYEDVLRVDPTNEAARRGVEKVAADRSDYYRAAYDQTRAELLENVDKAWELSVPPVAGRSTNDQTRAELLAELYAAAELPAPPALPTGSQGSVNTDEAGVSTASPIDGSRGFNESEDLSKESVIRTIADLENERRQWIGQMENVEKVESGPVLQHAAGLWIQDDAVMVLLPQREKARRELDAMQSSGLGRSHPSFTAQAQKVEALDRELNEAIKSFRATLTAKLELADEQVNRLASKLEPATRESVMARLVSPVVAKPVIVEPTAETVAADEPFSTFSLHVSDASFKLAQAAMERGEVPAAEGIRPEEFYNAFDYGDPAPASGEPVVCVTEQSAHPAFAQRNLLRIGVRTGSQGRGASTPLNLTLLIDHSGSMEREDRSAGLAMAVRQLSGLLKEGDTITVAGFSRQPRLLADRLPGARAQELNELIAQTPSEGGTNLEEGLKLGEELAKRQFNPAAQNRVVLFTDGAANLGDARPEALQARIEGLRQQGVAFDAAGFGADGLNDKLLERLTRNGNGRYYIVDGPEDADAGFAKQLAGAFRPAAENVKVQVRFNPARVAKYKLIGFEEHRLKKEDFRNDAVDAAEMAAEEAGNALYQIETLPQGEGEVGEVSVRFRDVASGQMVERTWTIPYDVQAPAFDRATPSIQLAGLAAFTAEKLRAAPMADAVDFQQLGQVYAGVRARYPNSQPVADLGSMIGRMK